jgi:putative ABC transport system substrate-binding protein
MRRREFVTLVGGAAAWSQAARAQQAAGVRRIGVLMNAAATDATSQSNLAAFVQVLAQLGWIEERNIQLHVRWNAADAALARIYSAQLIGLTPDVILTASTTNLTNLQHATSTVPIVFVQVSDPVAQGFVSNLTRPGRNLTGFSSYEFSIGGKWVEFLKQMVPALRRVAVMENPDTSPQSKYWMRAIEGAAASFGVDVVATPVRAPTDIEGAVEGFARQPHGGLILPTDAFTQFHRKLIIELAVRHRVPTIYPWRYIVAEGGLMSYGSQQELVDQYRQAAAYVDRILKGAKPGDLPVQLASDYRLVINLKTARVLGLDVPPMLLARADEAIE